MSSRFKLLPVLTSKMLTLVISALVVIAITYITFLEVTKSEVELTYNDEEETIITRANTVRELLAELDISASFHDDLSHHLDDEITSGMAINYKEAKPLSLTVNETKNTHYTTEETVSDFFEEIDLTVSEHDDVNVSLDQPINEELDIIVNQAIQVTINDATDEETVWTTERSVEDLLAAQSIELDELDRLEPARDQILVNDMMVRITRVEEVTDVIEEKVEFSTVRRNDSTIEKGKEKVVASGADGLIEKQYKVTLENGEEVDRELISEEVKKESEQRVVAVGTKVIPRTVSRGGNTAASSSSSSKDTNSGSKTITMRSTAYTANCAGCSGITATGINLNNNPHMKVIAVDPSVIPLGTRVHVEGYGEAIAGDTGGAIKGNKIDVHVPTKSDAYSWGRRSVKVTILN